MFFLPKEIGLESLEMIVLLVFFSQTEMGNAYTSIPQTQNVRYVDQ